MSGMTPSQRLKYFHRNLEQVTPRLLSAMDRCPVSASRGCLDREYWAWATKEFANIDMQRGVLILAYVYTTNFAGNKLFQQQALLQWLKWGVDFWIKHQSKQGGFDHLYPCENSWMATAFTLSDMIETYHMVAEKLPESLQESWISTMQKAGDFLCRYDEKHGFISNHRAGAAAALLGLANLMQEDRYAKQARVFLAEIFAKQSDEGWFLEYEGADPGYQTLDTHYQARIYEYTDDENVLLNVKKSIDFLKWFIHPDGSIGGEYGSRNCPHYFPGGIEKFAQLIPEAESIAVCCTQGIADGTSCGIKDADIRNELVMATSYVYAAKALEERQGCLVDGFPILPWEKDNSTIVFKEAGVGVHVTPNYYLVFSAAKGGVVKIFDKEKKKLKFSSCGYTAKLQRHDITTHILQDNNELIKTVSKNHVTYSCIVPFSRFRTDRLASPWLLWGFRFFNLTFGRLRILNDFVRKYLIIGRYLKHKKNVELLLHRTVQMSESGVTIEDKLINKTAVLPSCLVEHGFFSTIYMASARYFRQQDVEQSWSEVVDNVNWERAVSPDDSQRFLKRPLREI